MNSEKFSIVKAAQQAGLSEDEFKSELFCTVTAVMMARKMTELRCRVNKTIEGEELTLTVLLSREKA